LAAAKYPHLLLHGPPGTGKSSVAASYVQDLLRARPATRTLTLNASDYRAADDLACQLGPFIHQVAQQVHVAVLEESDSLLPEAQEYLCSLMDHHEEHPDTPLQLLLVVNDLPSMVERLTDRCDCLLFAPLPSAVVTPVLWPKVQSMVPQSFSSDRLSELLDSYGGDLRKTLNHLQLACAVEGGGEEALQFPVAPKIHVKRFLMFMQQLYYEDGGDASINKQTRLFQYIRNVLAPQFADPRDVWRWLKYWVFDVSYATEKSLSSAAQTSSKSTRVGDSSRSESTARRGSTDSRAGTTISRQGGTASLAARSSSSATSGSLNALSSTPSSSSSPDSLSPKFRTILVQHVFQQLDSHPDAVEYAANRWWVCVATRLGSLFQNQEGTAI
jgi:hypothetical protein